jgi:dTDP-4-amino-4,6-dideoxygalactose transaminase
MNTNGQQSNFGPYYYQAKEKLDTKLNRHHVFVSSGTSALQISCSMAFGRGKIVAVPDFTMVATLHAVVASGNYPIIAPCDPHTGMIQVPNKVSCAVIVSPFGAKIDHEEYEKLNINLVYDLAGGFPMTFETTHPICYSTHATKNFSTREGGIISCDTKEHAEEYRKMSCFSMENNRHPTTIYAGNYKMDEYRCKQIADLDWEMLEQKIALKRRLLGKYASVAIPLKNLSVGHPSLCVCRVGNAEHLENLALHNGLTFKRYYLPLLSDIQFRERVPVVEKPNKLLREYIAFPSELSAIQESLVIDFIERNNKW